MGEHPKPVDDDIERALASMRAGFLSASEQIAAHIASLDAHLVNAPSEGREVVRAQVARLVANHDRITARVTRAPAVSWDSFKIMVSAVKQQQNVLDAYKKLYRQGGALLENAKTLAQQDGLDENVRAMVEAIIKSSEQRFGRYLEKFRH